MACEDPVMIHTSAETKESEAGESYDELGNIAMHYEASINNGKEENKVQEENDGIPTAASRIAKRKMEASADTEPKIVEHRISNLTRPTISSASRTSGAKPVTRRSSTGGLPEKQPIVTKRNNNVDTAAQRTSTSSTETLRKSLPELRTTSVSSANTRTATRGNMVAQNSTPVSANARTPRTPSSSNSNKQESLKKASMRSSMLSNSSNISSPSLESTGSSSSLRRPFSRSSSHSIHSPTLSSEARSSNSRDARLIMLPQVEIKASDGVRLDLRGQKIQSLKSVGLNWSENLEFIYLRDNLLSSLEGFEVLKSVKVLDLSFNNFKGPGFEPLENCKALQQLYLAGNQITSLKSLPELPNMEFLSVAQNKLKSLSMACQPRLQVLAASKNKISTLKGFPYLPVLEHLRVEENPILKMSHLEAASILLVGSTLKSSMTGFCGLNLWFNQCETILDLSRDEVALAKRYPPHTALCIRDGWDLCRPEQAADSTFMFLLKQWKEQVPPGYLLKKAFVDHPFEGDACRCHFVFARELAEDGGSDLEMKYQWFIGDRSLSKFIKIDDAFEEKYVPKHDDIGKVLKVECTPIKGDIVYASIYAVSLPVSAGTGVPKVLKIDVRGDLLEGCTIKGYVDVAWCGAMPGKSVSSWLRREWNGSPVVIAGAEEEEYRISSGDVDSCLVYMHTPVTKVGTKGEPQYIITDVVKAAPPSVSNVQIIGDAVEGSILRGSGEYFGGKEGLSTYEWLREEIDTGEYTLVQKGTNKYTLTKEDVARRLVFVYIPVNVEGKEGRSVSVVSQVVKKAPPKVTCVKIMGELKEGSKVTATGIVTGGTEACSRVQWFKTNSSTFESENLAEALSTSKPAKAFRIPLGAVGKYIVAKFTPMNPDGEAGQPIYAISEAAIEMLPPSLNFLSLSGDYVEGEVLTASYGYIGGHEGMSIYNWHFHEGENDSGTLIPEASGHLQYQIPKVAIGRFISFACTPVRSDGICGEQKTCFGQERVRPGSPRLLSLEVTGKAVEGTTLSVEKKYWGGEEGESIYQWFRTRSDGTRDAITGAKTSSYVLSIDDVGFFVAVSCEPTRMDGFRGPVVISEQVGPVVPGHPTCLSLEFSGSLVEGECVTVISSYSGGVKGDCLFEWFKVKGDGRRDKMCTGEHVDLTFSEVGYCLELVYTPVRADGVKGRQRTIRSSPVAPGDPQGLELVVPDGCEGQEVVPETNYFGGKEGVGKYIWFRSKDKLQGSALLELSNTWENVEICGQTLTYTPSLEDVGSYLALYWIPIRSDGKCGKPLVSICESPVLPALPSVSNVSLKKLSVSTYCGEGCYLGGHEGESLFTWYRVYNDGSSFLIEGAHSQMYEACEQDYNCRLLFGYTPVRSDSVVGEIQLSERSEVIFPELPRIEKLSLKGKAIEGEVLTVSEVIPSNENQQLVWDNYKKQVSYRWLFSHETGAEKLFEVCSSQRSCSYKVRFEDIGCILRCECTVTDVFGRSSEPAFVETAVILPGIPKIDKLEIEGRGFHTNLYAVRGIYTGGKEGKSRIQWLRSMLGSPDLISISGETGRMYEANVDDVGYRLVVVYTPVREDGTEGEPVSASTDPIAVEPDVLLEVKQKLEAGSVKFEVLCDKDRPPKLVLGMGNLERRILEVNRKRIKVVKPGSKTSFPTTEIRGSYAPPFHVELFRNDQHRLRIVVDSENEADLMVQTRHLRDVIVLVIRGLAQRFNSTSLNTLLKMEM